MFKSNPKDEAEKGLIPVLALRAMLDHLQSGTPLSDEFREWMISGISKCLESKGDVLLDRALGLKQWGGMSLRRSLQLAERDEMIVGLWQNTEPFRYLPAIGAAKLMALSADRYETIRWPRERYGRAPPASEPDGTWWRILDAGLAIPKAKRLQQILETWVDI